MIQCNMASTSKTGYYKWRINNRLVMQCEGTIFSKQKSSFTPILHLSGAPQTELSCVFAKLDQACTCTCTSMWAGGSISDICCN
jgi:hypothetical protein